MVFSPETLKSLPGPDENVGISQHGLPLYRAQHFQAKGVIVPRCNNSRFEALCQIIEGDALACLYRSETDGDLYLAWRLRTSGVVRLRLRSRLRLKRHVPSEEQRAVLGKLINGENE